MYHTSKKCFPLTYNVPHLFEKKKKKLSASAGSRTRIDCLEGNHANRYTTDAALCCGWLSQSESSRGCEQPVPNAFGENSAYFFGSFCKWMSVLRHQFPFSLLCVVVPACKNCSFWCICFATCIRDMCKETSPPNAEARRKLDILQQSINRMLPLPDLSQNTLFLFFFPWYLVPLKSQRMLRAILYLGHNVTMSPQTLLLQLLWISGTALCPSILLQRETLILPATSLCAEFVVSDSDLERCEQKRPNHTGMNNSFCEFKFLSFNIECEFTQCGHHYSGALSAKFRKTDHQCGDVP